MHKHAVIFVLHVTVTVATSMHVTYSMKAKLAT